MPVWILCVYTKPYLNFEYVNCVKTFCRGAGKLVVDYSLRCSVIYNKLVSCQYLV